MCEFYWMADRLSNLFNNWEKPQINNRTCRATEERFTRKMSLEENCQKGYSAPLPHTPPHPKEGLVPCVPGRPPSSAWMLPMTELSLPSQSHRSLESFYFLLNSHSLAPALTPEPHRWGTEPLPCQELSKFKLILTQSTPPGPEQCLAHSMHPINIYCVTEPFSFLL